MKQKRIISLLLSLVMIMSMAFGVVTEASAEEIDITSFTYVVDNMKFFAADGEVDSVSEAKEVSVDVTRRRMGDATEKLIIATYTTSGEYIGMYTVEHYIEFAKTSNVRVSLNIPEGKMLGEIRAFVWNGYGSMSAKSNCLSSNENGEIDPKLEYDYEKITEFIDVTTDNKYADAILKCADLEIMSGDEDGYFNPTGELTRAEAAAILSHITGKDAAAQMAESISMYSDVIPGTKECGYLNLGYIASVSNGVMQPYSDITVKDFMLALIKALGYENEAAIYGGWPMGYIQVISNLGLLENVKADFSAKITREQAAQIVSDSLNVPLTMIIGYETTASGTIVPRYQKFDGNMSDGYRTYFKSFMTETYGMYEIEGYVLGTYKTSWNISKNEIEFGVANCKYYELCEMDNAFDMYQGAITSIEDFKYGMERFVVLKTTDENADDYIGMYTKVTIKITENDDYEIINITPFGNNIVVFDASLLDTSNFETAGAIDPERVASEDEIRFFETETSTKSVGYTPIDKNMLNLYVNGVQVSMSYEYNEFIAYVLQKREGNIKLLDTYKTDGRYDTIYVDYCMEAVVEGVIADEEIFIRTLDGNDDIYVMYIEPDYTVYTINIDGKPAKITDLKVNDIISIEYDVSGPIEYSNFYNITVTGKNKDTDKDIYNKNTRFAVVTAAASEDTDEAGDEISVIPALYNGEEIDMIASDTVVGTSPADLEKGDVIFFRVDNKGYIDRIDVIFSMDTNNLYDYEAMLAASIVNGNFSSAVVYPDMDLATGGTQLPANFVTNWYTTAQDAIQIVYGPIVKADDNYFGIGQIDNMQTDTSGVITATSTDAVYEIDLSDETNIYLYDYSLSKNQLTVDGYISESSVTVDAANEDIIDWNLTLFDKNGDGTVAATETSVIADSVAMALALVVDGVAVDVLVLANN